MQQLAGFATRIVAATLMTAGGIAGSPMAQAQSSKLAAVNKVLIG